MVNGQLRTGGIVDRAVLAAFLGNAPRAFRRRLLTFRSALSGSRFAGAWREGLAVAAAAADLGADAAGGGGDPGDRALDVGGGSGYGAALLNIMGAKVVALESDAGAAAAAQAELVRADRTLVVVAGLLDEGSRLSLGLSTSSSWRELSESSRMAWLRCSPIRDALSELTRQPAHRKLSSMKKPAGRSAGGRSSKRAPTRWTVFSPG